MHEYCKLLGDDMPLTIYANKAFLSPRHIFVVLLTSSVGPY